ncbi:hypothetical protein C4D60_Mb04t16690 [Musa balbisiana]|uniref:Uncharacterized protein n=1 Tax=Musa balbisiana TaxID=52838 RepID=A0A4S8KCH3_MUSBA|nr:hypothetical protein C4D60_Mb04t16690 [Musa balbisiana]
MDSLVGDSSSDILLENKRIKKSLAASQSQSLKGLGRAPTRPVCRYEDGATSPEAEEGDPSLRNVPTSYIATWSARLPISATSRDLERDPRHSDPKQAASASRPRHKVVDTNSLALEGGPECRGIGRLTQANPQLRGHTRSGLPGNTLRRENLEKSTSSRPQSAMGNYSTTRACRHPKVRRPTRRPCRPRPFRTSPIKSER